MIFHSFYSEENENLPDMGGSCTWIETYIPCYDYGYNDTAKLLETNIHRLGRKAFKVSTWQDFATSQDHLRAAFALLHDWPYPMPSQAL